MLIFLLIGWLGGEREREICTYVVGDMYIGSCVSWGFSPPSFIVYSLFPFSFLLFVWFMKDVKDSLSEMLYVRTYFDTVSFFGWTDFENSLCK